MSSITLYTWTTSNCLQKREKELETLIQAIRIYSQDIEMEFGIEKCVMLIMKSGKRQITEGIEMPNQERIRALGQKKNDKYLRMLEVDIFKKCGEERKK